MQLIVRSGLEGDLFFVTTSQLRERNYLLFWVVGHHNSIAFSKNKASEGTVKTRIDLGPIS